MSETNWILKDLFGRTSWNGEGGGRRNQYFFTITSWFLSGRDIHMDGQVGVTELKNYFRWKDARNWNIHLRGGRGTRAPSRGSNSFNFMQFWGKFGKIVCWRPLEDWRPYFVTQEKLHNKRNELYQGLLHSLLSYRRTEVQLDPS